MTLGHRISFKTVLEKVLANQSRVPMLTTRTWMWLELGLV